ncbi:zinc transporter ZntB, partial [Erwinia amylovora]|nr:zinc transporter ZntB [Erwinia amylovora]
EMRVYIHYKLIFSTRRLMVSAVVVVIDDLNKGYGAVNVGGWLVVVCDVLTVVACVFFVVLIVILIDVVDGVIVLLVPALGVVWLM